jgi:hypothetical protein
MEFTLILLPTPHVTQESRMSRTELAQLKLSAVKAINGRFDRNLRPLCGFHSCWGHPKLRAPNLG